MHVPIDTKKLRVKYYKNMFFQIILVIIIINIIKDNWCNDQFVQIKYAKKNKM